MKNPWRRWAVGALVGMLALEAPRAAQACGGCFSMPPPGPVMVQTVTYHRMALSASPTQTTLWDQFGYAGRAEEFSWILPIQGGPDVRVELADVRFLAGIDNATAVNVESNPQQPYRQCPYCYTPPPEVSYYCETDYSPSAGAPSFADASSGTDAGASDASADTGVSVLREESVGPYEVVVIRGDDAMALRTWLTSHNYVVPASMEPVLAHYIAMHMDFVALRLRDAVGVGSMQPVRVRAPGYQPLLPLRMVAAGIGDSVELVLFTLADSRMEPQNFPGVEIGNDDLQWDFRSSTTPLGAFRQQERLLRSRSDGRAWLAESAQTMDPISLQTIAANAERMFVSEGDGGGPSDDMAVALTGLGQRPVLTRLHADLHISKLDRDLLLSASTRGDHSQSYRFGSTLNAPTPPQCEPLRCESGLIYGGEGQIQDPFGQTVAPDTTFDGTYLRNGARPYTPRFNGAPRHMDNSPYTPPVTRRERRCTTSGYAAGSGARCSVGPAVSGGPRGTGVKVGAALGFALAGLCVGVAGRRARKRKGS